ncbi:hypothetical protein LTR39_002858, partial [Cryomyces antarcticus]
AAARLRRNVWAGCPGGGGEGSITRLHVASRSGRTCRRDRRLGSSTGLGSGRSRRCTHTMKQPLPLTNQNWN